MRLLIVEDEEDLRSSLEKALREEGYAVDAAGDGVEGLYKAQSWSYDAIVLDVMLPGLDGWGLLGKLRETRRTPVLMLTARDALRDRVRGLDLGCDDYVVKPFALAELFARLRALIRRSSGVASAVVAVDGVAVDTAGRTVTCDGRPVELTAREYALVEYLVSRAGRVVSRTELYDHLFAENDETFSNLLDVHVCNVRKKTRLDFIATRRGHGYIVGGG